jgi:hypothetical protein
LHAKCAGAQLARARVGIGNLYSLVRSEIVVKIGSCRLECARSRTICKTARRDHLSVYFLDCSMHRGSAFEAAVASLRIAERAPDGSHGSRRAVTAAGSRIRVGDLIFEGGMK